MKIGIVSEGASDFFVLKHIVERYLKEYDVYTIPLKPKLTRKGKQEGFGTWQGVFSYISGRDKDQLIVEAVKEGCRFVVIQIDTDVCEEYGVAKNLEQFSDIWEQVKNKLRESVHPDFPQELLLFAICIQELECWLIPFVSSDNKDCSNVDRCLNIVNKQIRTRGVIDKDNKNSDAAQRLYRFILEQKRKPKEIAACAEFNYGFKMFIEQLEKIKG